MVLSYLCNELDSLLEFVCFLLFFFCNGKGINFLDILLDKFITLEQHTHKLAEK